MTTIRISKTQRKKVRTTLRKWKINQISKLNINQVKAGIRAHFKSLRQKIRLGSGWTKEAMLDWFFARFDLGKIPYDCFDKKPKVQAKPKKRKFNFCINVCGFDECDEDEDCERLPYFMEEMKMKCEHVNQCGDAWYSFMATTQQAKDWISEHQENIEEYTALYTETKKRKSFYWGDMNHW
mgnify:CR=1 FL=1|jgi:hypothetical protein|tara:strand:+ start:1200 stop:1742 length:543 start_codon:yes stop_codon:yes gene_type:complete